MVRYTFLHKSIRSRKYTTTVLASSWTLGLCFGLCSMVAGSCNAAFYDAVVLKPAFLSTLSVLLLPIVLSMLAVFTGQRWLLFPLAFLKAFAFAYVGWNVVVTFGSAGWLIRLMLMFSDCVTVPLLLWFWNRALTSEFDAIVPAAGSLVLTVFGIGMIDYGIIAPFLVNLSL